MTFQRYWLNEDTGQTDQTDPTAPNSMGDQHRDQWEDQSELADLAEQRPTDQAYIQRAEDEALDDQYPII